MYPKSLLLLAYYSVSIVLLSTSLVSSTSTCSLSVLSNDYTPIGTLRTRNTSSITNPYPFSVGTECMDRNYTIYDNWKMYLAATGSKEARVQGGWYRCEPTGKGIYDYNWLDNIVYDMYYNQSVTPWIQLSYGNPNYGIDGGTEESNSPLPNGTALTAFFNWVTSTVNRYNTIVTTWEIWNEPEIGKIDANDYANFAIQVAKLIKQINSKAIIRFGVFAGVDITYAKTVLSVIQQTNTVNLFDVLTYHPYAYNPDSVYDQVSTLHELVTNVSTSLSIAQGENGAPSQPFTYGALGDYNWTECSQSKWVSRRIMGDRSRDIPTSTFTLVDICYITDNKSTINTKGLIEAICPDKTIVRPKLSYSIVQRLYSTMDNTVTTVPSNAYTVQLIDINHPSNIYNNPSTIYTSLFISTDGKNRIVFSAWNASNTPANADQTITNVYNVTLTVNIASLPMNVIPNRVRAISNMHDTISWRLVDVLTGTVYSIDIDMNQQGSTITYTIPYVPIADFAVLLGDEVFFPIGN